MIEGKVNKHHLLLELKKRDGLVCGICKLPMKWQWDCYMRWVSSPSSKLIKRKACDLTIDHKIPRGVLRRRKDFVYKKGWQWDDLANLQLAHFTCNNRKGDETWKRTS